MPPLTRQMGFWKSSGRGGEKRSLVFPCLIFKNEISHRHRGEGLAWLKEKTSPLVQRQEDGQLPLPCTSWATQKGVPLPLQAPVRTKGAGGHDPHWGAHGHVQEEEESQSQ